MKHTTIIFLIKRFIDIVISLIGILLLIPITLIVIILKLIYKDSTPVFYVQKRIGQYKKTFTIYKFNTMITKANIALKHELKTNNSIKNEYFLNRKIVNDFRVTTVGKLLRRTNIDEWPQFINILKNDMSLIGPRPYLLSEKKLINKDDFNIITSFKPGLTGLWQINNKFDKSFGKRIELDKKYCSTFNPLLDIKIFFRTLFSFFPIR